MTERPRRQRLRLAVLAALSPALIVSTCHERPPPPDGTQAITVKTLATPPAAHWPTGLALAGAWELTSKNSRFGGYSALIATADDRLIAYSDGGSMLGLRASGSGWAGARIADVAPDPEDRTPILDFESATYDPVSGTVWLGIEGLQAVRRFRSQEDAPRTAKPEAMADWPQNGGPEAMTRLRDGRFIVMAERDATLSLEPGEGLLFPRDPLLEDDPVRFRFVTGEGFQPTDMAQLPDGRVLILLRALGPAWPPFRSRLVIADPRDIVAGEPWPWRLLADIDQPQLRENYEGLAVARRPGGGVTIWLISDDNLLQMQRTLLLQLAWQPGDEGQ